MRARSLLSRIGSVHVVATAAALLVVPSLACDTVTPPVIAPPRPTAAPPPEAPPPEEPLPGVRLPRDTRPTGQAITLSIDPRQDHFSGVADISITLDHAHQTVWLHGKGFHVSRATATAEGGHELAATWRQRDESGMATLTLLEPLPAGHAKLHIEYDAPFGPKLEGLHTVTEGGVPYAFTQFESIAARDAFPCFDEPGFKIPWDETLVVPADDQAIANTHELDRKQDGSSLRVHFAPTLPLPSYLVAFAGRTVRHRTPRPKCRPTRCRKRPLGLRAVTAKGRGRGRGVRARAHRRDPGDPRSLLRESVPVRQARHPRRARQRGRDGERWRRHLRRPAAPVRREDSVGSPEARLRQRDGARAGAPVGRRPCHCGVVGRHLAQRSVRDVGGYQDGRPVGPEARPRHRASSSEHPGSHGARTRR